jgi:L-asparaginase
MNIYLLYTGGTIGCVGTPLAPLAGPDFVSAFQANVEGIITAQLPGTKINYDYFPQTLDSTNMQPSDWVLIAQRILTNYSQNDAFLVLHGTDTMAWTSSALSFLLPGISKPLFVTGAQLPLFYQQGADSYMLLYNTDALRNVLGAIEFMTFGVPEVGLYFADNLYRGNRVVKSNASKFTAFSSPNYPALGTYGVLPRLDDTLILPTPSANALDNHIQQVSTDLETIAANINAASVIQFLIFPAYYDQTSGDSLLVSMLDQLSNVSPALKGIIFESFGEGNIPDFEQMQTLLASLHAGGMILVDCTQVYAGDVNYNAYATGAWLKGCGVLSGYDMTPIAALTKLIVQMALDPSAPQSQIENTMGTSLAGEMTSYYALSGYQNEFLSPGESLYSINGTYQFTNEDDGTLALYDVSGSSPAQVWSQACGAQGRLVMQADCNLVFYDKDSKPLFATGTQRIGTNATFQVNDDGSLCIYDLYTGALIYQLR